MRLQKEEKIAAVLVLMALSSLAIAAWATGGFEQSVTSAVSSQVSVKGKVIELNPTKSGGNLIIKLDSVPASIFVPQDSGAQEIMSKVKIGDKIRAKGRMTEFQGSEEIKASKAGDIEVIEAGEA